MSRDVGLVYFVEGRVFVGVLAALGAADCKFERSEDDGFRFRCHVSSPGGMPRKEATMSMRHVKEWSDEFPRSGLRADGPQWDPGVDPGGPSMTKQEFADEADINSIMARYEQTKVMPEGRHMYEFGEAISTYSYQESLNAVIAAEEHFGSLSARIRDRFGNDPEQLFRFLDDPKNRDEAVKLGLVDPPAPEPDPIRVVVQEASANAPPPQPPSAGTAV